MRDLTPVHQLPVRRSLIGRTVQNRPHVQRVLDAKDWADVDTRVRLATGA